MKPPRLKTRIFDTRDDALGLIPGPIRIEVAGDVIWACSGHVSIGRAFRYADGKWRSFELDFMPNFILAISETEAIVGGIAGNLVRTTDAGVTWKRERLGTTSDWLICASRDRGGRIWIGQQGGRVWRAKGPRGAFAQVAQVRGSVNTVRQISDTDMMAVTEKVAHRLAIASGRARRAPLFKVTDVNMIDGAVDDRGAIVIVASGGKGWFASDGKTFEAIDLRAGQLDFDAVFWVDGWFTVLGYDGALRISSDGETWKRVVIESKKDVRRLGGIAAYRGGWLVGAGRTDPAISGTLAYLGNPMNAPLVPALPPAEADDELVFETAERYALMWATTWAALPDAELHASGWMKLAASLRA